jgi:hypothetical protein
MKKKQRCMIYPQFRAFFILVYIYIWVSLTSNNGRICTRAANWCLRKLIGSQQEQDRTKKIVQADVQDCTQASIGVHLVILFVFSWTQEINSTLFTH